MNNFINNIISRNTEQSTNVKPRLRGKFEPESISSTMLLADDLSRFETHQKKSPTLKTVEPGTVVSEEFKTIPKEEPDVTKAKSDKPYAGKEAELIIEKDKDVPFRFSPSLNKKFFEKSDEPEEKRNEQFEPVNKSTFQLLREEPGLNTSDTPEKNETCPATEPLNVNLEIGRKKRFTVANLEQSNKIQVVAENPAPFATEKVKPALKESKAEDSKFKTNKTEFQGLLGEPPGLRNYKKEPGNNSNTSDSYFSGNAEARPVIKVTIGRIDVRAVTQPTPSANLPKTTPKPKMSLEDYLKQRNGTAS